MDLGGAALLAGAAAVAGAINAVAGGGTLVSFPAAIAVGLTPLVANTTNAVALTPGSLGAAWAYRREIRRDLGVLKALLLPSLAGGLGGAGLLLVTPQRVFDAIVPLLVLFATLLLLWQNLKRPGKAAAQQEAAAASDEPPPWVLPSPGKVAAVQLLVSLYGGYFGAGMGIMMLAALSILGQGVDIHRMNGVKTVLAGLINGVAAIAFLAAGAVDFRATGVMAVASTLGGLGGAAVARRVNPRVVRWAIVALGLVLSAQLAWKRLRG